MITIIGSKVPAGVSVDALRAAIHEQFGEVGQVTPFGEGGIQLVVAGETVTVSSSPDPLPRAVLEGPVHEAYYWPDAAEQCATHVSHIALRAEDSSTDAVVRAQLLSRVTSVLLDAADASFVYWDAATMVHDPVEFRRSIDAMGRHDLPLRLWVSFRLVEEDDGTRSLATDGLEGLGHREIEIWGSPAEASVLLGWAYNTAHYLLVAAPEIQDGQVIAVSQTRWVHVVSRPSMLDAGRTVFVLVLDEGEEKRSPDDSTDS